MPTSSSKELSIFEVIVDVEIAVNFIVGVVFVSEFVVKVDTNLNFRGDALT